MSATWAGGMIANSFYVCFDAVSQNFLNTSCEYHFIEQLDQVGGGGAQQCDALLSYLLLTSSPQFESHLCLKYFLYYKVASL